MRSCGCSTVELKRRVPAARLVAGLDLDEWWRIVGAMTIRKGTTRREAAALRHQLRGRHHPPDGREPTLTAAERRHGTHETDGVRMLRILEDRANRAGFDHLPRIHDNDLVGDFRHNAK